MIWRILLEKILPLAGVALVACLLWRWADSVGWLRTDRPVTAERPQVDRDGRAGEVVPVAAESQGPPAPPLYTHAPPMISRIEIPDFPGSYAIWGALGYQQGSVWFGVSAQGIPRPSAHLFEYQPETGKLVDRGDVLTELRRVGISRPDEQQMKIHSRIVQAEDGYLYFASMDEQGELTDGSKLPTWGSHLWRIRAGQQNWEHLLSVPQGLVAVSCQKSRWVYALGYFDHVLYQYDTRTRTTRAVSVGSVGGHISRNLLSDERGHVYVPRVRPATIPKGDALAGDGPPIATLVEFDATLRQVGESPLEHYGADATESSHGIIAFTHPRPGTIVFATARGFLYQIVAADGPATVTPLGWFHPNGPSYTPALFTGVGGRYLLGTAQRGGNRYDWLVRDSEAGTTVEFPLRVESSLDGEARDLLLYGSDVADRQGRFYLGGRYISQGRKQPILLQIEVPAVPRIASADSTPERSAEAASGIPEIEKPVDPKPPKGVASERPTAKPSGTQPDTPAMDALALEGTGHDWLKADQEQRRGISLLLARWLLPGADSQRSDWLARRYVEHLDSLFSYADNVDRRLADVMPIIHALVMQPEAQTEPQRKRVDSPVTPRIR